MKRSYLLEIVLILAGITLLLFVISAHAQQFAPYITIDTKVYTISKSKDFLVLSPVGTVPLGAVCDQTQVVAIGAAVYYVVPIANGVQLNPGNKNLAVLAKCACSGQ